MKVFCYTRTENEAAANEMRETMERNCKTRGGDFSGFWWDPLAGQRGLTTALRRIERAEGERRILVDSLADLARDLPSVVKQIESLLDKGVSVEALKTGLEFNATPATSETKVIRALAHAHHRYVSENIRKGVATAKAAGAGPGRPTGFTLDDTRETITRMANKSDDGEPPSTRDLAREIGCGKTKANQLIQQWKAEREIAK